MADSNDMALGFALGQDSNGGCNNGAMGSWGEMIFAIIILAMFAGGDGFGNGGGLFGNRSGGSGVAGEVQRGFDTSAIINKLDGINSGLCDGFYAVNNSMLQGFHGVDNAICNLGNAMQQGFNASNVVALQNQNALSTQLANCCCENRQGQADIKYQMATDTCAITTAMANNTRDIIDNQNANYRGLMDFMVQSKIDSLQSENQSLKLAASQASQNSAIGAMIAASEATILRRTGAECPSACYVVQPPTPVNFPVNGCGNFAGWNNGGYGCGNGCGSCC